MVPLSFAGEFFRASADGALFHEASGSLMVADLHLEKASFFGSTGQFLPPYDSRSTLSRLADLMRQTGAARVVCLGDNYHDSAGEGRLSDDDADRLCALTGTCEFIWVVGNHDPDLTARHGGRIVEQAHIGHLTLRHNVGTLTDGEAEISGHFHPQLWLTAGRRRRIRRGCFVRSQARLIMPAFGTLTGGMNAADTAITKAMDHAASDALVVAGERLCAFPLSVGDVAVRRA